MSALSALSVLSVLSVLTALSVLSAMSVSQSVTKVGIELLGQLKTKTKNWPTPTLQKNEAFVS